MVVVPAAMDVKFPPELMVATALFELVHAYPVVGVAVYVVVDPTQELSLPTDTPIVGVQYPSIDLVAFPVPQELVTE